MAYHISKDGVARQCRAKSPESCTATPADQKEHYDSKEDAQAAYESKQAKNTFKPLKNSVERGILLNDKNTLKKTGVNAYANSQEKRQSTDNLRSLNKDLREANYELIELEDKYETAWNDRRKEIEIEISDKKAAIKEIEQEIEAAKRQKTTSEPVKRDSLDIAAEHLQTSQQIEELIDYNNSNRKKDFVFKHNDPSYAEKTPKEQGDFLIDLVNKEDALKKEFNDSKAKNKQLLKKLSQDEINETKDKVYDLSGGSYLFSQNNWTVNNKQVPLHEQLDFHDESDLAYVIYEKNGQFLIKEDYGFFGEDNFKPITDEFEPDRLLSNVKEALEDKYNSEWLEEDDFDYDSSKPSQKEFVEKQFVPLSKFLKERYNVAN